MLCARVQGMRRELRREPSQAEEDLAIEMLQQAKGSHYMKDKPNRQIPLGERHSKLIRLVRVQQFREECLCALEECL